MASSRVSELGAEEDCFGELGSCAVRAAGTMAPSSAVKATGFSKRIVSGSYGWKSAGSTGCAKGRFQGSTGSESDRMAKPARRAWDVRRNLKSSEAPRLSGRQFHALGLLP